MNDSLDAIFEEYSIRPEFLRLKELDLRLVRDRRRDSAYPKVVCVGDTPSAGDGISGMPLAGLRPDFDELLASVGLLREDVYVTHLVKYAMDGHLPMPQEYRDGMPYLQREMRLMRPQVIVAMGRLALRYLCPDAPPLTVAHGQVYRTRKGRPVLAVYHPSLLVGQPTTRLGTFRDWEPMRLLLKDDFE